MYTCLWIEAPLSLLASRIALWAIPDPDVVFFLTRKRGREWGEPCLPTVGSVSYTHLTLPTKRIV